MAEKEYIERGAAIAKCNKLINNAYSCPNPSALEGVTIVRDLILTNCETGVPTADVVEVRHGHWKSVLVKFGTASNTYVGREQCSECGSLETEQRNYCPNCGAKMDGKDEG